MYICLILAAMLFAFIFQLCKQNMTSLSLLAGRTVYVYMSYPCCHVVCLYISILQLPEHFSAYLVLVKKFGHFKFLCYYMNNFLRNFCIFERLLQNWPLFFQSQSGHFKFLCYYMSNFPRNFCIFERLLQNWPLFFNPILVLVMLMPWCKF